MNSNLCPNVSFWSVAFVLWTILLKYNAVGRISIFNFLIPIFGTVLSGIFLNESILEPSTWMTRKRL